MCGFVEGEISFQPLEQMIFSKWKKSGGKKNKISRSKNLSRHFVWIFRLESNFFSSLDRKFELILERGKRREDGETEREVAITRKNREGAVVEDG